MRQVVGIVFLLLGLVSVIYNQRSAREYAETWGRRLKHGYVVGRIVLIVGGTLLLLLGLALLFR